MSFHILVGIGNAFPANAVWVTIPEYRRNSAAYIHTFVTYRLPPPTHHFFLLFDCYIPLVGPLSFTNGAFDSVPNAVWAHKMVVVEEPPLILFPGLTLGTPRRQGLCSHSALFWAPEKGGVRQPILILSPYWGPLQDKGYLSLTSFVNLLVLLRKPEGLSIHALLCGPLSFGWGLTIHALLRGPLSWG